MRRRLDVIREMGLVRRAQDVKDDDRIRAVLVTHIGDGIDAVECWVSFNDTFTVRVIQVDDDLRAIPDDSVLIDDINVGPGGLSDAELTAIFHLAPQHIWMGIDE